MTFLSALYPSLNTARLYPTPTPHPACPHPAVAPSPAKGYSHSERVVTGGWVGSVRDVLRALPAADDHLRRISVRIVLFVAQRNSWRVTSHGSGSHGGTNKHLLPLPASWPLDRDDAYWVHTEPLLLRSMAAHAPSRRGLPAPAGSSHSHPHSASRRQACGCARTHGI
jgi:ABC-type nickel/cobalt efflux system permease component RcnA